MDDFDVFGGLEPIESGVEDEKPEKKAKKKKDKKRRKLEETPEPSLVPTQEPKKQEPKKQEPKKQVEQKQEAKKQEPKKQEPQKQTEQRLETPQVQNPGEGQSKKAQKRRERRLRLAEEQKQKEQQESLEAAPESGEKQEENPKPLTKKEKQKIKQQEAKGQKKETENAGEGIYHSFPFTHSLRSRHVPMDPIWPSPSSYPSLNRTRLHYTKSHSKTCHPGWCDSHEGCRRCCWDCKCYFWTLCGPYKPLGLWKDTCLWVTCFAPVAPTRRDTLVSFFALDRNFSSFPAKKIGFFCET